MRRPPGLAPAQGEHGGVAENLERMATGALAARLGTGSEAQDPPSAWVGAAHLAAQPSDPCRGRAADECARRPFFEAFARA